MKRLLISIFIYLIGLNVYSQYFPKNQFKDRTDYITSTGIESKSDSIETRKGISYVLRKSAQTYFSDKNSKLANKGALFAFTKPKDKESSIAINAGLIIAFSNVTVSKKDTTVKYIKSSLSPYLQFDRNTLIDEEQNNLLVGFGYTNNFLRYEKFKKGSKKFNVPVKINGAYRKDYENKIEAFQSSLLVFPRLFEINKKEELTRSNWFGDKSIFDFDIGIGLEYDYRFNSENVLLNGNLFRTLTNFKFLVKPRFNNELKSRFIASFDWNYRYIIANSTSINDKDFSLYIFKLDYQPKIKSDSGILNNIQPAIGIIHENGENPTNGFNDQAYWALSLSLKI